MPPKKRITRELILKKAFDMVHEEGIDSLNARALAKKLNCSTMPIFQSFQDMRDLKMEVKRWIDEYYSAFLNRYVQKEDYLFTISFAYINFARMEHHFFGALFVNPLLDSRTVREVIDSPWNRETIKCTAEQFGISIRESEELYRDIRFYAHGIATQLYGGNMTLGEEEIQGLLHHALERFLYQKFTNYPTLFSGDKGRQENFGFSCAVFYNGKWTVSVCEPVVQYGD